MGSGLAVCVLCPSTVIAGLPGLGGSQLAVGLVRSRVVTAARHLDVLFLPRSDGLWWGTF